MKTKIPWTGSRITSAILAGISLLITLLGVQWFIGGSSLIHHANTTNIPEDWSGPIGFAAKIAGLSLIFIGGVLTLLFSWLYRSTVRRLRHHQVEISGPKVVSPTAPKVGK